MHQAYNTIREIEIMITITIFSFSTFGMLIYQKQPKIKLFPHGELNCRVSSSFPVCKTVSSRNVQVWIRQKRSCSDLVESHNGEKSNKCNQRGNHFRRHLKTHSGKKLVQLWFGQMGSYPVNKSQTSATSVTIHPLTILGHLGKVHCFPFLLHFLFFAIKLGTGLKR